MNEVSSCAVRYLRGLLRQQQERQQAANGYHGCQSGLHRNETVDPGTARQKNDFDG